MADDLVTTQRVAIKKMQQPFVMTMSAKRAYREFILLTTIKHPNVRFSWNLEKMLQISDNPSTKRVYTGHFTFNVPRSISSYGINDTQFARGYTSIKVRDMVADFYDFFSVIPIFIVISSILDVI